MSASSIASASGATLTKCGRKRRLTSSDGVARRGKRTGDDCMPTPADGAAAGTLDIRPVSESTAVIKPALVHFTALGARLMRNFVGGVWAGKAARLKSGAVQIKAAQFIEAGLGTGSSDLAGWTPVVITPEMVGQRVAVFTACECKTLAYPTLTPEQRNYLDQVTKAGGQAWVARETAEGVSYERWKSP